MSRNLAKTMYTKKDILIVGGYGTVGKMASDASSFVTGAAIVLDGEWTAQ